MKLKNFTKIKVKCVLCFVDAVLVLTAYGAAYILRYGRNLPAQNAYHLLEIGFLTVFVHHVFFRYFDLYKGIWRYVGMRDLFAIIKGVAASSVVVSSVVIAFYRAGFSVSILVIAPLFVLILTGGKRFLVREYLSRRGRHPVTGRTRMLIFGAGDLGESVLREIHRSFRDKYRIVGFIDDDVEKWHKLIHGVPVLGGRESLTRLADAHNIEEIVIAIGHSRGKLLGDLMVLTSAANLKKRVQFKTVPTIYESLSGGVGNNQSLRKIELSDLLHRRPVQTSIEKVSGLVCDQTVLVTGAGGTIGSELSRQILKFKPKNLLLLENSNTALFYIEKELREKAHNSTIVPIAGDVKDRSLLENVFAEYKPALVFHAAAHKHVPLMEANPQEAIKNNTLATHGLVETAMAHGTDRLLFISTDKAVKPSSVMGVSKRLSEMIISSLSGQSKTKLMSVRFGNVLGSSGSVVNIFKEQIANGGPVTITHPDVTRYFMTTQEAVQLVLQACAMSTGGEVFVLNMGEPVKVIDLAKNLIRLAGLEPGKDIEICAVGLRPGEKMHEELFRPSDIRGETGHPDIFMAVPEGKLVLTHDITKLRELSLLSDPAPLLDKAKEMVKSFNRQLNSKSESKKEEDTASGQPEE